MYYSRHSLKLIQTYVVSDTVCIWVFPHDNPVFTFHIVVILGRGTGCGHMSSTCIIV